MNKRSKLYYRQMRKKAIEKRIRKIKRKRLDNPPYFIDSKHSLDDPDYRNYLCGNYGYGDFQPYGTINEPGRLSKNFINSHKKYYLEKYDGLKKNHKDSKRLSKMNYDIFDSLDDENLNLSIEAALNCENKINKELRGRVYPNKSSQNTTSYIRSSLYEMKNGKENLSGYDEWIFLISKSQNSKSCENI